MKFYLLTIFAITTLWALLAFTPSANAQEKKEFGEPRSLGPRPIKSPLFSLLDFLRANTSISLEFSISGNITETTLPVNTSSSLTFDILGNLTSTGPAFPPFPFPFPLPVLFFQQLDWTALCLKSNYLNLISAVDSDDDVSPRVQDVDVKAPLVREPRGASF
ncbi:uncharacterized protein LOC125776274 [Bactrocera dorsalis]|uniref:Uncharacterized protein LOC125776274 n=1 Tax=Bactrocera dorsalis TaxID=27457 RepID=A0ABM3J3D3_BACDO|nr:uncharacterized protein LOC125776274 [Bactrocera dorsalis]